ncbi:MAG: membrane dipeptidase [Candidatus Atribacteria bacterium]|nr:membrane dipeptidase [Candidatus Atribacteria bacterium]
MRNNIVCDAHCDTVLALNRGDRKIEELSSQGHLDIPRLKKGMVDVQVFAVYIEQQYKPKRSLHRALQLIDCLLTELEKNYDSIEPAYVFGDIERITSQNKIAVILAIEGGEAIEGKLYNLRIFHRLGVRLITLTWNQRNDIADGSSHPNSKRGLTTFGRKVVKEMNRLGMLIDVSHLSESGFWDVIKTTSQPIIASHSNSYTLCPHRRNLKDEQVKAIAENGGMIGVTYVPDFLTAEKRKAAIDDVINHIDYLVKLAGIDFVGLGSDFDGCEELPVGLEGADKVYKIGEKLAQKGYTESDIDKIMGKNFLRLFQQVINP